MITSIRPLCFAVLAVLAAPSYGTILVIQPPGDHRPALSSDFAKTIGLNQQADDFILTGPETVKGIYVWGSYAANPATPPTDSFTVRFFTDNGSGNPNTSPFYYLTELTPAYRVDSGYQSTGSNTVYEFGLDLNPVLNLSAGITYYLSVVNDTNATNYWNWLESPSADTRWHRDGDYASTNDWSPFEGNFSIAVSTENAAAGAWNVPAPGTLWLFGIGLAGLMGRRKQPCSPTF